MPSGNIGKIYSRKRFILTPRLYRESNKENNNGTHRFDRNKTHMKIIKIVVLLIVQMLVFRLLCNYFEPIFSTLCEEKAKATATIITNRQSTLIMNKYQYDQLYTIEKDENGNLKSVIANVVPINNLISDLTENIQHEFDNIKKEQITVTLGNLSGIYFLSGSGPQIPIDISIGGTVETDIKSEFISQGINQTLHRVYVNFECDMKVVTLLTNYSQKITNQVIIAEHVIVGNIPSVLLENN